MRHFTDIFPRGLIVSCQAGKAEPLFGSEIMARMALAAQTGGAVGIRANGPEDIRAMKEAVTLPVIGIYKQNVMGVEKFITPTFEAAEAIARAGSDMIAIDATARQRPDGETVASLIRRIREELEIPVMADCSTFEEALDAAKQGADVVASTLAGYTPYTKKTEGPDLALLREMIQHCGVPVIGEGRFHDPHQAAKALQMGAYAVVVGGAITRPQDITSRFVSIMKPCLEQETSS